MKLQDLFETSPFSSVTTDMPMYDDMLKADDYLKDYFREQKGITFKVTRMSPEEYVASVSKAKDIPMERLRATREAAKVAEYAKQMKEPGSKKFPILTLDYARFPPGTRPGSRGKYLSQEGLHRAFAAIDAGVDILPVLVVKSTD